eukprot:g3905.t1
MALFHIYSFTGLLVNVLFPPAFFALFLLMLPLPTAVRNVVVKLIDSVLFFRISCGSVKVKLFWIIIATTSLTFLAAWERTSHYSGLAEDAGALHRGLDNKRCRAQRDYWISLFALTLYSVLHRFRHDVKAHIKEIEKLKAEQGKKTD